MIISLANIFATLFVVRQHFFITIMKITLIIIIVTKSVIIHSSKQSLLWILHRKYQIFSVRLILSVCIKTCISLSQFLPLFYIGGTSFHWETCRCFAHSQWATYWEILQIMQPVFWTNTFMCLSKIISFAINSTSDTTCVEMSTILSSAVSLINCVFLFSPSSQVLRRVSQESKSLGHLSTPELSNLFASFYQKKSRAFYAPNQWGWRFL